MTIQHEHRPTRAEQRQAKADAAHGEAERTRRRRRTVMIAWIIGAGIVAALIAAALVTSRPQQNGIATPAAPFTMTNTDGQQVSLADYAGKKNVLLYFSEGAGCQACLAQMGAIEKKQAAFDKLDTVVLPVVMNTKEQIMHDMTVNGVKTPFLLDDGRLSTAYGTIGKGMHGGLPGHSFVLIDKTGTQRWYGEYPSMWLAPDQLATEVSNHLPSS
ncbi:MAG: redoxin domain-containing protein [Candidatus Nanopelagicales bacterium]